MANVGKEPQGTRVVLFKQSSFLFSHQGRMGERGWKNEREAESSEKKVMFCVPATQS